MIRVNLLAPELTPAPFRAQKHKSFILVGKQVLCKTIVASPTATNLYAGFLSSGVSSTLSVPKNPLRVITARSSQFEDFYNDGTQHLAYFIDTLACGHQQILFNLVDDGKKRHRCPECAAAKSLENRTPLDKKPCGSVPAIARKKVA